MRFLVIFDSEKGDNLFPHSYGLPTRAREVAEFMLGLEKTKAQTGEITQSVRAISLQDMHRIHGQCFRKSATTLELRQDVVRYVCAKIVR